VVAKAHIAFGKMS